MDQKSYRIDSARTMANIKGDDGKNLERIASATGTTIQTKGNKIVVSGDTTGVNQAGQLINQVRQQARKQTVMHSSVEGMVGAKVGSRKIRRPAGVLFQPKTAGQARYYQALQNFDVVFGVGPAGTGKTHIAMAAALQALDRNEIEKIVICRPVVEAGEKLGFLPGGLEDKLDPYLRPIYDAMEIMVGKERAQKLRKDGSLEIVPLAYMRGRTLQNAYVILDEAQNTTQQQIKMFLTRLGENSKMIVTGDRRQSDLRESPNGLVWALNALTDVPGIEIVELQTLDVVRHRLVGVMIEAFGEK